MASRRVARLAHKTYDVALLHIIADAHENFFEVRVASFEIGSQGMLHEHKQPLSSVPPRCPVAITRIRDHKTVCGGTNHRAAGGGDINCIIVVQYSPINSSGRQREVSLR